MKKSILILTLSFTGFISFSQTGKIGTVPIYSGEKTLAGSQIKQVSNKVKVNVPMGVGTLNPYSTYSMTVKGSTALFGASTGTTANIFTAFASDSTQRFKIRNDGAIFTGTTQAISTSTFMALDSSIITIKNGLIISIE